MLLKLLSAGLLAAGTVYPQSASLGIFTEFDRQPASAAVEAMRGEIASLFESVGLSPAWRTLKASTGAESFRHVVLVRFHGICHHAVTPLTPAADDDAPFYRPLRLGATLLRGDRVLPLIEVECDNLRQTLRGALQPARASAFGKAMGRVLAHELYHSVLGTLCHTEHGLTRSLLNGGQLMSSAAVLSPDNLQSIAARLK